MIKSPDSRAAIYAERGAERGIQHICAVGSEGRGQVLRGPGSEAGWREQSRRKRLTRHEGRRTREKTETIRRQSKIGSLDEEQKMGAIAGVRDGLGEPRTVAAERISGCGESNFEVEA